VHSTSQVVIPVQLTTLPGPTRAPQRSTDVHSYRHRAPQIAPHETVLWQDTWQSSPQDDVQSFMSKQACEQPAPHTAPQWTIEWHDRSQPSPSAQLM